MSGKLRFSLLGEPQLTLNGEALTGFISAKVQALLFYLVVTGQPHQRETLAALLWGDMPDVVARKNLTKALSNLRRLVGPWLRIERHTVEFQHQPDVWLDVQLLQQSQITQNAVPDLALLTQLPPLYRGDFLTGIYVKDAPEFEDWLTAERERLRQLALRALKTLADHLADGEELSAALEVTTRLLALDPLHEAGHRLMMNLLARQGQRNAALAHYDTCRRILAKELGAEPMAETQALYARLKASSEPPPHNLPAQTTPFVGREAELGQISAMLADPTCRLLTIAGPGGIGKTRLASQLMARYIRPEGQFETLGFADGLYFVSLAALESAAGLGPALAEALDFKFQPQGQPWQQVLAYLRHKTMLLVLDNFEGILAISPAELDEAVSLIKDILQQAPGVKIVVTSRVRLQAQGEQLFTLVGLEVPHWPETVEADRRNLEQITASSAVRLFEQSARRLRPAFALSPANLADVVRICRLAEGMPLGIMLAAAWVELLSPAEIAAEISHNLDFLNTDWRDVPARQRSIRAVFDHSWSLLTAGERELFQQLCIFAGDFSRPAALAVTGASLRELLALVNKSLLLATAAGHYTIHELLRQYGLEKLDHAAAGRTARDRHLAYYAAFMRARSMQVRGPGQQAALSEIEAEQENIRLAWQWAVTHQHVESLRWMCDPLSQFYVWRGRYEEGELALRQAVEPLRPSTATDQLYVRAKLLTRQSVFNRYLGQAEAAVALLQESLAVWEELAQAGLEVRVEKAFALLQLGETLRDSRRREAQQCYEASLALFQASDFAWGMAHALAALGWLIQHFGAYDEAKQLYQQSLAIHQTLENEAGAANALMGVGGISLYQGYPAEAEALVRQSVTIRQKIGDRAGLAHSLSKLGETMTWLGDFGAARELFEESRLLYDNLGLRSGVSFAKVMLGQAHLHLGQKELARLMGEQGLASFRKLGSERGIGYALLSLGSVELAQHQENEAERLLRECLTIYREIGQRDELAQALALLAYAAQRAEHFAKAAQYLHEALQIASEIRAFMPMMLALPVTALLALTRGQDERAVELFALAWRYPFVANSRWFEELAGASLAARAANLSPDRRATAHTQSHNLDLEQTVAEILAESTL